MITAALFDMDGLMIDSDRIISRSYEIVLKEYGKKPRLNGRGIVHTPGISAIDNWRNLAKQYDINADLAKLADRKNRLHVEYMEQGVNAMPGLMEILAILHKHDVRMAVASSSKRILVEHVVRHLDVEHYFDTIVVSDEVAHGKPAPDIFLAAAQKLGTEPSDCVVFEDAINGVRAAKAAKMACIAIPAKSDLNNPDFQVADFVLPSLEMVDWDTIDNLN